MTIHERLIDPASQLNANPESSSPALTEICNALEGRSSRKLESFKTVADRGVLRLPSTQKPVFWAVFAHLTTSGWHLRDELA